MSEQGGALNLLALRDQELSLYHLWMPDLHSIAANNQQMPLVEPTLIPTSGTIHPGVIHVGITPLDHSHLIGVKSFPISGPELYVISHSPNQCPADNIEEIKLTNFSRSMDNRSLSSGERISFINNVGDLIVGRVFLPSSTTQSIKDNEPVPVVVLIHGGDQGADWRGGWLQYLNQNCEHYNSRGFALPVVWVDII